MLSAHHIIATLNTVYCYHGQVYVFPHCYRTLHNVRVRTHKTLSIVQYWYLISLYCYSLKGTTPYQTLCTAYDTTRQYDGWYRASMYRLRLP